MIPFELALAMDLKESFKSKALHEIPNDIDKFRSGNVVKQIIEEYKQILE